VIIILRKSKSHTDLIKILKGEKEINSIAQNVFVNKEVILTSLDKEKYLIVEKIEKDSVKLCDICDAPRGITVKSSEYSYNENKRNIQVLGGTNLERYNIKKGNKRKPNRYLENNDVRISQKSSIFTKERIIYQNIASSVPKIIATLETNNLPTDDTLNNLFILKPQISSKYILVLLNSKLFTFFLRYAIINCSTLTIHLDKPYVGKFPIRIIPESQQQPIIKLVDKMLSLNKRLNEIGDKQTSDKAKIQEEINITDAEINELVYKIYGITEEEKKVIEESLK